MLCLIGTRLLPIVLVAVWPTLPLSGRQGAWGGGAKSWWWPVHSRGLLGVNASYLSSISRHPWASWPALILHGLEPSSAAISDSFKRAGQLSREALSNKSKQTGLNLDLLVANCFKPDCASFGRYSRLFWRYLVQFLAILPKEGTRSP
jgi:hypothetical protein